MSRVSCNSTKCKDGSDGDNRNGLNPLHVAVQRGYLHLVEHYLKQGSNVNSTCSLPRKKGYTPLHLACERHKKEIVEKLLEYGADVNANIEGNITPLHIAVKRENAEFVEILLHHGANVDVQDVDGRTALYLAAENGDAPTVEIILKFRPDTNNDSNRSSLRAAVCGYRDGNRKGIIENLISYGFTSNSDVTDNRLLHEAVKKRFFIFITDFLKYNDVNFAYRDTSEGREGYTMLHTACGSGSFQIVRDLLDIGADVSARTEANLTPLHVAVRSGHEHIIKLLVDRGANVDDEDKDGNTALYLAIRYGFLPMIKDILSCRPDVNHRGNKKSLCAAVMSDSQERETIIEELLRYGFSITHEDADDHRLLHCAVVRGDVEIVRGLLKCSTESHVSRYECEKKATPLHYAALNKRKEVVELLLEYGSDVNAGDFEMATPAQYVIMGTTNHIDKEFLLCDPDELKSTQQKCLEVIEILLRHGADPKIRNCNGMTVLHYTAACYAGMKKIAKMFFRKGVDVRISTEDGVTALSNATYSGNRSLAKLFLEHGALDFGRETDRKVLKFASRKKYEEYFSVPLEHDLADINSVDGSGTTALQFAYKNGCEDLIRYLLEYGADVNVGKTGWLRHIDKNFSKSADIVRKHILKLYTAGLNVFADFCRTVVSYDYELMDLAHECREELEEMKYKKIRNTTVSFCDILTDDVNQLAAYAENGSILSCVEALERKNLFPLYASVIKGLIWRGIVRRGLLNRSTRVLRYYCDGLPELPEVCVKQIFGYLTDQDLRVLIRSQQESL